YEDAATAVESEAGVASLVYRDLTAYGTEMDPARHSLRSYVNSVLDDEWPLLREGKRSNRTEERLSTLFANIAAVTPTNEREAAIYRESLMQLNEMVALRRARM